MEYYTKNILKFMAVKHLHIKSLLKYNVKRIQLRQSLIQNVIVNVKYINSHSKRLITKLVLTLSKYDTLNNSISVVMVQTSTIVMLISVSKLIRTETHGAREIKYPILINVAAKYHFLNVCTNCADAEGEVNPV